MFEPKLLNENYYVGKLRNSDKFQQISKANLIYNVIDDKVYLADTRMTDKVMKLSLDSFKKLCVLFDFTHVYDYLASLVWLKVQKILTDNGEQIISFPRNSIELENYNSFHIEFNYNGYNFCIYLNCKSDLSKNGVMQIFDKNNGVDIFENFILNIVSLSVYDFGLFSEDELIKERKMSRKRAKGLLFTNGNKDIIAFNNSPNNISDAISEAISEINRLKYGFSEETLSKHAYY